MVGGTTVTTRRTARLLVAGETEVTIEGRTRECVRCSSGVRVSVHLVIMCVYAVKDRVVLKSKSEIKILYFSDFD